MYFLEFCDDVVCAIKLLERIVDIKLLNVYLLYFLYLFLLNEAFIEYTEKKQFIIELEL